MSRTGEQHRSTLVIWQVALALAMLIAWQWGAKTGLLDPFFFSSPIAIGLRVGRWIQTGTIWTHVSTTFTEAALSFMIGSLLGVVVGLSLAGLPMVAAILDPYIRIANALPRVILAPVFLLWFGLGIWSKVALGVTVVFFVVFFNTFRGAREDDRAIIDNARMLGATQAQLVRHVIVPSALTWIFSSLHVSIGLAIIARSEERRVGK